MRRVISIIIGLLLIVTGVFAVTFSPYQPDASFRSTSAYLERERMSVLSADMGMYRPVSGSLSAISAANFEELNSEEPSESSSKPHGRVRTGRGNYSGLATGTTEWHSPVGDVAWGVLLLLGALYAWRKRKEIVDTL